MICLTNKILIPKELFYVFIIVFYLQKGTHITKFKNTLVGQNFLYFGYGCLFNIIFMNSFEC